MRQGLLFCRCCGLCNLSHFYMVARELKLYSPTASHLLTDLMPDTITPTLVHHVPLFHQYYILAIHVCLETP